MLFARQGKKFDYDLKQVNMCSLLQNPLYFQFLGVQFAFKLKQNHLQLRFSSDLLLEIGAGIELTTAAFPQFFLPMACVANVVKVCPHQALAIPFWAYSISKVLLNIFFVFTQYLERRCCYINLNTHSNL